MHETGVSNEDAYKNIKYLSAITWVKMNKDQVTKYPFYKDWNMGATTFIGIAMNLAMMAMFFYRHRDRFGVKTKDRILSLFVQPFPLYMWLSNIRSIFFFFFFWKATLGQC